MSTSTMIRPALAPDDSPTAGPSASGPLPRAERMSRTQELLEEAARTTDAGARQALVDEVVLINMPVARSIAHRYLRRGINEEDLHQVAYLALVRAAQNYDVRYERDFLTYAVPTIRGELKKHFRDAGWTVRPPRRIQELQGRIAAVTDDLTQDLGRSPRPSEIADRLDEPLDHVLEALSTDGCFVPASLDRPLLDGTDATLGECIDEEIDGFDAADARVMLAPLVRRLSQRDRRIIELRFFQDATQQEIADDIGVTQMHVSRLITRILGQLRSDLVDAAAEQRRVSA
jgi:RNA polymerase sigma-B factor